MTEKYNAPVHLLIKLLKNAMHRCIERTTEFYPYHSQPFDYIYI